MESGAQARPKERVEGLKALFASVLHVHRATTRDEGLVQPPPTAHQVPIAPTEQSEEAGMRDLIISPSSLGLARCRSQGECAFPKVIHKKSLDNAATGGTVYSSSEYFSTEYY
jgi:hypothetical protein